MARITRNAVTFTYDDAEGLSRVAARLPRRVVKRHLDHGKCSPAQSANRRFRRDPISVCGGRFPTTGADVTMSTTGRSNAARACRCAAAALARIGLASAVFCFQAHTAQVRADDAVAQELADCQNEEKSPSERIKICTALIGMFGIDSALEAEALLNRGMARQHSDDLASAVADYTQAIALNPQYPALYVQRAAAYADLDEFALAIEDLTRAIELKPVEADHFAARGELYAEMGEPALAEADYGKALELEADHEQARAGLETLKKTFK